MDLAIRFLALGRIHLESRCEIAHIEAEKRHQHELRQSHALERKTV
jgi:hypothetical protein